MAKIDYPFRVSVKKTKNASGDERTTVHVARGAVFGVGGRAWKHVVLGDIDFDMPASVYGGVFLKVPYSRYMPWGDVVSPPSTPGGEYDEDGNLIPAPTEAEMASYCANVRVAGNREGDDAPSIECVHPVNTYPENEQGCLYFLIAEVNALSTELPTVIQYLKSDFYFPLQYDDPEGQDGSWKSPHALTVSEEDVVSALLVRALFGQSSALARVSTSHAFRVSATVGASGIDVSIAPGLVFFEDSEPRCRQLRFSGKSLPLAEATYSFALKLSHTRKTWPLLGEYFERPYESLGSSTSPLDYNRWCTLRTVAVSGYDVAPSSELVSVSAPAPRTVGNPGHKTEGTSWLTLATIAVSKTDAGSWTVKVNQLRYSDIFFTPHFSTR